MRKVIQQEQLPNKRGKKASRIVGLVIAGLAVTGVFGGRNTISKEAEKEAVDVMFVHLYFFFF